MGSMEATLPTLEDRPQSIETGGRPHLSCVIAARNALELSQSDLAEKLKVTQASISRWEAGEREPGRADVQRLAAFLNLHPDTIEAELRKIFAPIETSPDSGQSLPENISN